MGALIIESHLCLWDSNSGKNSSITPSPKPNQNNPLPKKKNPQNKSKENQPKIKPHLTKTVNTKSLLNPAVFSFLIWIQLEVIPEVAIKPLWWSSLPNWLMTQQCIIERRVSHLLRDFLHLPVLYQNHSSASWWLIPGGFLGSCMMSECNSIWVDLSISLVHKYQPRTEVFRNAQLCPGFRGSRSPQHCCSGTGCGQNSGQETGSSATLILHLLLKNSQEDQGCLSCQDWTFTHTWRKRSWKTVSQCHLAIPDTQTSPWARAVDLQADTSTRTLV